MNLCGLCKNKPDRCSICINCDEKDLNTQLGEVYYHFGDLFEFAEIE